MTALLPPHCGVIDRVLDAQGNAPIQSGRVGVIVVVPPELIVISLSMSIEYIESRSLRFHRATPFDHPLRLRSKRADPMDAHRRGVSNHNASSHAHDARGQASGWLGIGPALCGLGPNTPGSTPLSDARQRGLLSGPSAATAIATACQRPWRYQSDGFVSAEPAGESRRHTAEVPHRSNRHRDWLHHEFG